MNSIRRHLTSRLLIAFALLLSAGGAAIYFSEQLSLYRELDTQLKFKALAMAVFTKPGRNEVEVELPRRAEPLPGGAELAAHFVLYSTNREVLAASPSLQKFPFPPRFGSLDVPLCWNVTLPDGTPGRAIGLQFVAKPPPPKPRAKTDDKAKDKDKEPKPAVSPVGVGLVMIGSRAQVDEQLERLRWILLGAGSVVLLATVLLVPRLLRQGLMPLDDLANRANRIDAANLQSRFPTQPLPEELSPIAQRLNDLLARLENSFERERRFSADLAHELRTPIAGLRTTAEVALQWPDQTGPESWQAVRELAAQMETMAEQLLALARAEHHALPIHREPVPLKPLLESIWQPLQPAAGRKQISLRLDLPATASLDTDAVLLRGILANLLGNAVEYSPAGSQVQIRFQGANGNFELQVSNAADNLKPEDIPQLFDRFWRKDPARTGAEHLGLGLSLAKSFAALLGYQLSASLSEARALTLRLSGPFSGSAGCERGG
jgi:two-component system sensor histidine kinase QseC